MVFFFILLPSRSLIGLQRFLLQSAIFILLSSRPLLLLQMTLLQLTLLSMAVYDTTDSVQVMTPSDFPLLLMGSLVAVRLFLLQLTIVLLLYMGSFLPLVRSQ